MLSFCVGPRLRALSATCLLLLAIRLKAAEPPCSAITHRVGEQQTVLVADAEDEQAIREKMRVLHTALRDSVARLDENLGEGSSVLRTILDTLEQMKHVRGELRAVYQRLDADTHRAEDLETQLHDCYYNLDAEQYPKLHGLPPSQIVTLTVLDRTESVEVAFDDMTGHYRIANRFRQGIRVPSHDPAASDSTKPVKVDQAVTASAHLNPGLQRKGWTLWLGVGADSKTSRGPTLCSTEEVSCEVTSGPYPGVRRGFGKGWAASEGVEVWLCSSGVKCVGKVDPIANINITWVLP